MLPFHLPHTQNDFPHCGEEKKNSYRLRRALPPEGLAMRPPAHPITHHLQGHMQKTQLMRNRVLRIVIYF